MNKVFKKGLITAFALVSGTFFLSNCVHKQAWEKDHYFMIRCKDPKTKEIVFRDLAAAGVKTKDIEFVKNPKTGQEFYKFKTHNRHEDREVKKEGKLDGFSRFSKRDCVVILTAMPSTTKIPGK